MRTPSWVLALLMLATPALSAAAEEMTLNESGCSASAARIAVASSN
jgi:hypothetical protein